ncbi:hypothetical protein SDC9_160414 [bioreactor metagenome]|uniref:Uncharacterized protein n=1 Tax=bioreactor metagenome TaxID=1076179 RepID=A0A645FL00_9ZZZZ
MHRLWRVPRRFPLGGLFIKPFFGSAHVIPGFLHRAFELFLIDVFNGAKLRNQPFHILPRLLHHAPRVLARLLAELRLFVLQLLLLLCQFRANFLRFRERFFRFVAVVFGGSFCLLRFGKHVFKRDVLLFQERLRAVDHVPAEPQPAGDFERV